MENRKVTLKLICPICGGSIWEHSENNNGEFLCVKCGKEFPCEWMIAVSETVVEQS